MHKTPILPKVIAHTKSFAKSTRSLTLSSFAHKRHIYLILPALHLSSSSRVGLIRTCSCLRWSCACLRRTCYGIRLTCSVLRRTCTLSMNGRLALASSDLMAWCSLLLADFACFLCLLRQLGYVFARLMGIVLVACVHGDVRSKCTTMCFKPYIKF